MSRFNTDRWTDNPYYHPEKVGLEIVALLEDADANYSFDTVLVVRDTQGTLSGPFYAAHDSGCSCPTPFEDLREIGDFTPIRCVEDLKRFVESHESSTYRDKWPRTQRATFYRKVDAALTARLSRCSARTETSLADIHEILEEEMIAAGALFLSEGSLPELEKLLEYDEWLGDERVGDYQMDGKFAKLQSVTRRVIEDAIERKGNGKEKT